MKSSSVKSAKDLSNAEKSMARQEIAKTIHSNLRAHNLEEILELKRIELSQQLGCPIRTINSITAYVRYWATQSIHEVNATGLDRDKIVAAWYERQFTSNSEQPSQLSEDVDTLAVNRAIEIFAQKMSVILEVAPITVCNSSTKDDPENEDYDNETKRKWRQNWQNYVAEHTTLEERKRMKVLCLPGKECLEIPLYIALGFDPKNISGAIKSNCNESIRVFLEHAAKLGFNPLVGDLSKSLPLETGEYDVVSLDFRGQASAPIADVLEMVPLAQRAIVMTNMLGKREVDGIQRTLKELHRNAIFSQRLQKGSLHPDEAKQLVTSLGPTLSESRDSFPLLIAMGAERKERWMFRNDMEAIVEATKKSDSYMKWRGETEGAERWDSRNGHALSVARHLHLSMTDSIESLFGQVYIPPGTCPVPRTKIASYSAKMFASAGNGLFYVRDHKKYKYLNEKKSPFLTNVAVLEAPMKEYQSLRKTLKFSLNYLRRALEVANKRQLENKRDSLEHHYYSFRTKNRLNVGIGGRLSGSDLIACSVYQEFVDEIPVKTFLNDLKVMQEIEERYPLNERGNLINIQPEIIT